MVDVGAETRGCLNHRLRCREKVHKAHWYSIVFLFKRIARAHPGISGSALNEILLTGQPRNAANLQIVALTHFTQQIGNRVTQRGLIQRSANDMSGSLAFFSRESYEQLRVPRSAGDSSLA